RVDPRRQVGRHVDKADRVAEIGLGVERLAGYFNPPLARELDFEDDADARLLFVEGVDEAAARTQIVNLDGNRQDTDPVTIERSWYACVLPAIRAAGLVGRRHRFQYSVRLLTSLLMAIHHGPTTSTFCANVRSQWRMISFSRRTSHVSNARPMR